MTQVQYEDAGVRDRTPSDASEATGVEVDMLGKAATDLRGQIDQLVQRLTPVLRPPGPEVAGEKLNAARDVTCPLAERLCGERASIESGTSVLRDLLSRLDV